MMTEAGFDDPLREAQEAKQRGDFNAAHYMLELAMKKSSKCGRPYLGVMRRLCVLKSRRGEIGTPRIS